MSVGGVDLVETAKGVVKESLGDDVTGMAAELSYRFFLAVFPFAIMMAALSGFIADGLNIENPAQRIVNQAADRLPEDSAAAPRVLAAVVQHRQAIVEQAGHVMVGDDADDSAHVSCSRNPRAAPPIPAASHSSSTAS